MKGEEQEETEQVSTYYYDLVSMQYSMQVFVIQYLVFDFEVGEANKSDEKNQRESVKCSYSENQFVL